MSPCQIVYRTFSGRVWVGAQSIEMPDPAGYAKKVQQNVADNPNHFAAAVQVIDRDTGEKWGDQLLCPYCEDEHDGPYTGTCLL